MLDLSALRSPAAPGVATLELEHSVAEWTTLGLLFVLLLFLDIVVIGPRIEPYLGGSKGSVAIAFAYSFGWVIVSVLYGCFVYWSHGGEAAGLWFSGYLLEWLLSLDNLFAFYTVFALYATPDQQKRRCLFWGIMGAILFRFAFLFVGVALLEATPYMTFVFGIILIYTGFRTAWYDDDDDPSKSPVVAMLQQYLPLLNVYDAKGRFFVRVEVDQLQQPILPATPANPQDEEKGTTPRSYGSIPILDFPNRPALPGRKYETKATMLFFVLCVIELFDVVFAVDSVTAVIAQVGDLYLSFSAMVLAVFGLRSTFFLLDVCVHMFSLLKYGVSFVLVLIGVKLMFVRWFHIEPLVVCVIVMSVFAFCIVGSVVKGQCEKRQAE